MEQLLSTIIFWLFIFGVFWTLYSVVKSFFKKLFKNPTRELLSEYLWWVDFASSLDINGLDEFKTALQKIKHKKIYQGKHELKIYLTKNEAKAHSKEFKELKIKDILKDKPSLIALGIRIERLTLYAKEDLNNIKRDSKMIWTNNFDVDIHMILKNKKLIYPKSYPIDSQFRFGYEVFKDESSLYAIYDVQKDELLTEFKYKSIQSFGNIVELSEDDKVYEIYDLKDFELLKINYKKTFPNILDELKEKIDLSKIELQDYLKLFPTPKDMKDLQKMCLWGARVNVFKVPSGYEDILEDSTSGKIEWSDYFSANIFDMSIELPVNFNKKNGEFVTVGIEIKYLILEKESRDKIARSIKLVTKENNSKVEVWLDDNEDRYGNSRFVDEVNDLSNVIKSFDTKKEAIIFIENSIDDVLKKMAKNAKDLNDLETMDIPENVSYFIKIDGEKEFFKTWQYIQDNQKRVYEEVNSMTLDKLLESSKLVSKGLSSKLLNLLTSVKVLSIKQLQGNIEICYEDEGEINYLTLSIVMAFEGTYRCYFKIDDKVFNEKVMDGTDFIYDSTETYYYKEVCKELEDIEYIHNISYEVFYHEDKEYPDNPMECEQISIIVNTKDKILKKYILGFECDEKENRYFSISSELLIKSFRSKLLADSKVITLSVDEDTLLGNIITINKNEEYGKSGHYSPYYTQTLKENSKSIIKLNEDDRYFYMEGIGFQGKFILLDKTYYEQFDEDDKKAFKSFALDTQVYLNSLFINKTFKNAYSLEFDCCEKYEEYIKSLEAKGYTIEKLYDNSEQPKPATLEIFRGYKENEELKLTVTNDWDCNIEINMEYNK